MTAITELINKRKIKIDYQSVNQSFKRKKVQAYTMLILSLFTISFFGIFAIRPTLKTITNLNRQIDDLKQVDIKLSEKINQIIGAQAEYEIISPYIPKIKRALPEKPNYIRSLSDIENIRNTSPATVSSVKIDNVVLNSKKPGFLNIELASEGKFIPIEKLVDKVLSNERLMVILTLSLQNQESDSSNSAKLIKLESKIMSPYGAIAP